MPGSKRELTIGLLWHAINSANLGVGALTVSNLALTREVCARLGVTPRFVIIGYVDEGVPVYVAGDDIEALPLSGKAMLPFGSYWRCLGGLDCVLDIGAGDSFADIYGLKRFIFMWLTKAMAIARGVPLQLSPQTVGPFTKQPQKALAAAVMNKADSVIARDPLSFEVAREMAPRTRVEQAIDVAFALPFERRVRAGDGRVQVGINVSGLLFNGGYTGANEFGMQISYADYTRRLIEALLARPEVEVHLIGHVNADFLPQDDDRPVIRRLAEEYPAVVMAPTFESPSAAKSYISGLDFLVAGRMHACIAAVSSGVPVVPVAYSRKFSGLFEGVLDYRHTVPVTGLDTEGAVAFTLERLDRRHDLAADIAGCRERMTTLLETYRTQLTRFLSEVAARG